MSSKQAANLFQQHREELGFVNRAQCREKDLYTETRGGEVVGAALVNHCVQKPQTTLYELAVDAEYREEGIATKLLQQVTRDTPHSKIIAKCPKPLPANEFYRQTGWDKVMQESGKSQSLNVWKYDVTHADIITTGRPDLTEYAATHGWLRGCRLDAIQNYERADVSPEFIDMHWEEPDRDTLLTKCMQHNPRYAIAGDYDGSNYERINDFADQLNQYAENVIIVPHEPGEIAKVPEWAIVGYSTPTEYAGTDAPIWEYTGRDVHILGGTMPQIQTVVSHLKNDIVSLDTNTHHRDATQFGEYWSPSTPQRKQVAKTGKTVREAYENSVVNMTYQFEEWGLV